MRLIDGEASNRDLTTAITWVRGRRMRPPNLVITLAAAVGLVGAPAATLAEESQKKIDHFVVRITLFAICRQKVVSSATMHSPATWSAPHSQTYRHL